MVRGNHVVPDRQSRCDSLVGLCTTGTRNIARAQLVWPCRVMAPVKEFVTFACKGRCTSWCTTDCYSKTKRKEVQLSASCIVSFNAESGCSGETLHGRLVDIEC